jgi:dipeptidase D
MARLYRRLTGQEARITAVHVGLETSVLSRKKPGLVMVNTGPDILDPHSVDERARLSSLPPYVRLLAATLAELAGEPLGDTPDLKGKKV